MNQNESVVTKYSNIAINSKETYFFRAYAPGSNFGACTDETGAETLVGEVDCGFGADDGEKPNGFGLGLK